MSDEILGAIESIIDSSKKRFYGVTSGIVTDIFDPLLQGRIKIRLPTFTESVTSAWARIAVPSAGSGCGFYFIPKVNDEVLVAFEQGDIECPYIVGSLWSVESMPPEETPILQKSHIRTFTGHDIAFDDFQQSIEITTSLGQKIFMDPAGIEISSIGGAAKVTLETAGAIKMQAATTIEMKAPSIKLEGANVEIKGAAKTDVKSGGVVTVQGPLVKIN